MKNNLIFALCLGLIVLLLPTAQTMFSLFPLKPLHGAVERATFPNFTFSSFLSGHFQEQTELWMAQEFGFRPWLVRTDNQINYSLFSETSTNSEGSRVIVGRNNQLFEKEYIDSLNGARIPSTSTLRKGVTRTAQLQSQLKNKGIGFVVLVSPNKARFHKSDIPLRFLAANVKDNSMGYSQKTELGNQRRFSPKETTTPASGYDKFLKLVREHNIAHVDSVALLEDISKNTPYPLFSTTGTHWNYYASCLVSVAVFEELNRQYPGRYNMPSCAPVTFQQSRDLDRDLGYLLNIWTESRLWTDSPYPQPKSAIEPSTLKATDLLFVGSSFLWTVFDVLEAQNIYNKRGMLYYFKSLYQFPDNSVQSITPDSLDWNSTLLSKDAVVLEINEAALDRYSYGFVESAIIALRRLGKGISSEQQNLSGHK